MLSEGENEFQTDGQCEVDCSEEHGTHCRKADDDRREANGLMARRPTDLAQFLDGFVDEGENACHGFLLKKALRAYGQYRPYEAYSQG